MKMYLYIKYCVKRNIRNINFKSINNKNDTCHVQSLEIDFYLNAPGSFDHVFTPWKILFFLNEKCGNKFR
jgi:hypothetical protein